MFILASRSMASTTCGFLGRGAQNVLGTAVFEEDVSFYHLLPDFFFEGTTLLKPQPRGADGADSMFPRRV